jgi:hypothetical protein
MTNFLALTSIPSKIWSQIQPFTKPIIVLWLSAGIGVLLRLIQYLHNRSLWMDESFLALYILNNPTLGLLNPGDYGQAHFLTQDRLYAPVFSQIAPPVFLFIEELAVHVFGNSEYVLRAWPLIAGIGALFLFVALARDLLSPWAAAIAVALFAVAGPLIYYSSELKQYSTDVAAAILLWLVGFRLLAGNFTLPKAILWGVLGAAAVWISHPAAFVLGGIGLVQIYRFASTKGRRAAILQVCVSVVWVGSFLALYLRSLRTIARTEYFVAYWNRAFLPLVPTSFAEYKWFVGTLLELLRDPVGLTLPGIGALALIIGVGTLVRSQQHKVAMLLLPVALTLLASGFHRYPFGGRLILFLVPVMILFIAAGIEVAISAKDRKFRAFGACLIVLLFLHPVVNGVHNMLVPQTKEDTKPLLAFVRQNWQNGDELYVYGESVPSFAYYAGNYGFTENNILGNASVAEWSQYLNDLDSLKGKKRVWLVFTTPPFVESFGPAELGSGYLDRFGKQLSAYSFKNSKAYLYDLSTEAAAAAQKDIGDR